MIPILYISPTAALGGAERSLLDLIRRLCQIRVRPVVALPRAGPLTKALKQQGVHTVCLSPGPWALRLSRRAPWQSVAIGLLAAPGMLTMVAQLRGLIRAEGIRLIHTNGIKAHLAGGVLSQWTGCPLICHLREIPGTGWLDQAILARLRRTASALIAPSHAVARRVGRNIATTPPVTVIPNGIEMADGPPPAATASRLGCRVGIVAPLAPAKGHAVFLRAARLVAQEVPAVQFFIVGDVIHDTWATPRDFRQGLEHLAGRLGVATRVTFTGFVPQPMAWMRHLDVVVSASVEPEGFGRVLLEAMAAAKPVVATDAGAYPEVVEEGLTGLLVPPGDPEALAQAICRLLKNPALRRDMGEAGYRRALTQFSLADHVRSVEQVYEQVLQEAS